MNELGQRNIMTQKAVSNRLWNLIAGVILAITVLRGIRYPSSWAYTHYLFSYKFGFVKRALIGSIVDAVHIPVLKSYPAFFWISLIILLSNLILIYLLMLDCIKEENIFITMGVLVFAASPAVLYLAHIVGYFDQIGLLVTLISLRINDPIKKVLFLIPGFAFALLAHEVNLLLFFPTALVSVLLSLTFTNGKHWGAIITFALVTISLGLLISGATIEKKSALKMSQTLENENYPYLRSDAFEVLYSETGANIRNTIKKWGNPGWVMYLVNSLIVTAPLFIGLWYLSFFILRKSSIPLWLISLCILASVSPLLLYMVAWDIDRWNAMAVMCSFIALYSARKFASQNSIEFEPPINMLPWLVLLLFWAGASGVALFDGYSVKQLPFREHQEFIFDLLNGKIRLP